VEGRGAGLCWVEVEEDVTVVILDYMVDPKWAISCGTESII